jgi:hypothetical protein
MGWKVIESRLVAKQLKKVPKDICTKYVFWRKLIETMGPNLQGGYKTHALSGNRKGQKSARLDLRWRVIFRYSIMT